MRSFQTYFGELILPAQSSTDDAIYHRALSTAAAKVVTIPSGARYAVFSNSSSLSGDFAASFGTTDTVSTASVFPAADSTAAVNTVINPNIRYLSPHITTIALTTPDAAAKISVEFFS